jgi:hypothetical protein
MAQPPLHWKRAVSSPIHEVSNLDPNIVNARIYDILQMVANAWGKKRKDWVKQLSSCMVEHSVAPKDTEQYATTFMDALEKVNGKNPKVFPPNSDVKALVNKLILSLPLTAQEVLLSYEEKYSWYSDYAYNFMQVRFQLIEVEVGCKEPSSFDWRFKNLMMVYSPITLPDLVVVNPTELKKCFMGLVWDKSTHFWKDMKYSSEINYMKSATNVLLHKMFEKTGINLTGQTAEQIRKGVLRNVKWGKDLKNFDAVDTVLAQLISFLSQTYVSL